MNPDIKVSVCITTYQHCQYIGQALESALVQNTNFAYEILVGDDGSSDGTAEIVREFSARYPNKIRPFFHGAQSRASTGSMGFDSARANFLNNIRNARGEYIALLDGDDYWTRPDKLQSQVKFLDDHRTFSACGCGFETVSDLTDMPHGQRLGERSKYELKDILLGNPFCAATILFRAKFLSSLPEWYSDMPGVFWPTLVICGLQGPIGMLPEVMAAYRRHDAAVHSSLTFRRKCELAIEGREKLLAHLPPRHRDAAQAGIDRYLKAIWRAEVNKGEGKSAREVARRRLAVPVRRGLRQKLFLMLSILGPPFLLRALMEIGASRPIRDKGLQV